MVGLYTAVPALVLTTLVGSSRHLVVAPIRAGAQGFVMGLALTIMVGQLADLLGAADPRHPMVHGDIDEAIPAFWNAGVSRSRETGEGILQAPTEGGSEPTS